jgi:hypothetical protein
MKEVEGVIEVDIEEVTLVGAMKMEKNRRETEKKKRAPNQDLLNLRNVCFNT